MPHRKHCLHYKDQAVTEVRETVTNLKEIIRYVFRKIFKTIAVYCENCTKHCVGKMPIVLMLKHVVHIVTTLL